MEIPIPLGLTIIAIALFVVWLIYQRKIQRINQMPDIPQTIPMEGFKVPVLATFTGQRGSPRQLFKSHNNLNPSLIIFEDRLECRVILRKAILLSEIENVDIWNSFATRSLQVYVKGKEDLFTANLFSRRNLAQVLGFLKNRGVLLSNHARDFLSPNST
jgi:hypothetical protein